MTKSDAETLLARYTTRTQTVVGMPHGWNYLTVEICFDGEPIGSYQRNYSTLFDTFVPFVQQNEQGECRVFALYSRHYTATRIMRLPECDDIGGEEPGGNFCPTGYFVPYDPERGLTGAFGFLSGCIWADDEAWEIHYIDLSGAANGVIKRDNRLGFLELPRSMHLREAIGFELYQDGDWHGEIKFITTRRYLLKKGHFVRDGDGNYIDSDNG